MIDLLLRIKQPLVLYHAVYKFANFQFHRKKIENKQCIMWTTKVILKKTLFFISTNYSIPR